MCYNKVSQSEHDLNFPINQSDNSIFVSFLRYYLHLPNPNKMDSYDYQHDDDDCIPTWSVCGSSTCDWIEVMPDIVHGGDDTLKDTCCGIEGNINSWKIWKSLNWYYTYWKYERLVARHNRIPIPICVRDNICTLWPSEEYKGYTRS